MKKCVLPLLAISVLQSTAIVAQTKSKDPHAPGEDIYKHYTGTIGTRQVTLDLLYGYQGSSNYGGSWYYSPDNNVATQFFIQQPSSFEHNVALAAHEQPDDTSLVVNWPSEDQKMAAWNFTISGEKLKGRWKSGDRKRNYNVELAEDYGSSVPLDLFVRSGSSTEVDASGKAKRTVNVVGIKPASACSRQDAGFISSEAAKFLYGNNSGELEVYYTEYIRRYINDAEGKGPARVYFTPVYNDNSLLVLKLEQYNGHVATEAYLSLDVRNHERLMPADMLDISNAKLSQLLETAARRKYGFTPGVKLSTWLVKDRVTAAKNFYPGHRGFYFTYQAGELAKNKAITLFLPYEQVDEMMPKVFKKRVE